MAASPSPPLRARAADRNSRNTQMSVDGLSMVATGPPGEGRTPDAVGAMAISRMSAKHLGCHSRFHAPLLTLPSSRANR